MVLPTLLQVSDRAAMSAPQKAQDIGKKLHAMLPFVQKHGSNILGVLFIAIVGWLLWDTLAALDWQKTWKHTKNTPWKTVALTLGLTILSYIIYASFDLVELLRSSKARPKLPAATMAAWSCYAVIIILKVFPDLKSPSNRSEVR